MGPSLAEHVTRRSLHLARGTSAEEQASAMELLDGLDAVLKLEPDGPHAVAITYDLRRVSLSEIERALVELGFALDTRMLARLRRAVSRYCESIERGRLAEGHTSVWSNGMRDIYFSRYLRHRHGCRDVRPKDWREYL